MASVGTAYVDVKADLSGFNKGIDDAGPGIVSKFGGIAGTAAKAFAVGAAAGIGGLAFLGKGAFDAATESAKIGKQTEAVIKSTGGAAGLTADQFGDLATAVSNYTGIDDEAIQQGENLLATFTNVKNGVGAGNDVFTQATKTLVDMGAALGGDPASNAVQLGKALQDPVKGITALTRVGVTFTDQQKDQIKAMQDAGNAAGAQKVILAELNKEFGGSAEAQATDVDKMKVAFGNLQEQIGGYLIPAFNGLAKFLTQSVFPVINALTDRFGRDGIRGVFEGLVAVIKGELPTIKAALISMGSAFVSWVQDVTPPLLVKLGGLLQSLGSWILDTGLPYLSAQIESWANAFVAWIGPQINPFLQELGRFIGAAGDWILNVGLPLLGTKLQEWGAAFVAWVGPLIPPMLLELGKILIQINNWILTEALPKILVKLGEWGLAFGDWIVTDAIPALIAKLPGIWDAIRDWATDTALPKIKEKFGEWKDAALEWVGDAITAIPGKMGDFLSSITDWLENDAPGLMKQSLLDFGGAVIHGIVDGLKAVGGQIKDFIFTLIPSPGDVLDFFKGIGRGGPNAIAGPHGALAIPGNALGGNLDAGELSVVGERGPELFVPRAAGTVVPNNVAFGGGALGARTPIVINTTDDRVIEALKVELYRQDLLYAS